MAKQVKAQKREVLDWLVPVICVVIAIGVLVGLLYTPIKNGVDYSRSRNIVLLDGTPVGDSAEAVSVKRPVAQTITWLELYNSFAQSYSNYSLYKYYTGMWGDSINLSGLVSDEEVAWVESNLSAMESQLGLKFYTYSDVDDETITSENVSASASLFALYLASGIENNLGFYMTNTLSDIKRYTAVASAAKAAGVSLDEEDLAGVEDNINALKETLDSIGYTKSFAKFLKDFMGDSIKEEDVREAYELMALYNKYASEVSDQYYDKVTASDRASYLDEHKDDFYTAEYLRYSTEDKALAEELKAVVGASAFKKRVAEAVLDKQYATEIAKLEQGILERSASYEDEMEASLNGADFGALTTYAKGAAGLDEALAEKFFDGTDKETMSLYLVDSEKGVYLVWFKEATGESVSVRTKFFAYDGLQSYSGIASFRTDVYNTVIASLDTEGVQYTAQHDDTAFLEMVDNCLNAVKSALTSSSSSYKTDAEAGSFEAWISDLSLKVGATASFENTEDDTTSYDVYMLISPMALDEEESVNGGYLKYETESAANEGKETLEGKTATQRLNALQNLGDDAVVNSKFLASDFDEVPEAVKDWFFSPDRTSGEIAVIAVEHEDDDEDEETTESHTDYYLVCFRSTMTIWEAEATEGAANEQVSDWLEGIESKLVINEKELTRLGVDLSEDEGEED